MPHLILTIFDFRAGSQTIPSCSLSAIGDYITLKLIQESIPLLGADAIDCGLYLEFVSIFSTQLSIQLLAQESVSFYDNSDSFYRRTY